MSCHCPGPGLGPAALSSPASSEACFPHLTAALPGQLWHCPNAAIITFLLDSEPFRRAAAPDQHLAHLDSPAQTSPRAARPDSAPPTLLKALAPASVTPQGLPQAGQGQPPTPSPKAFCSGCSGILLCSCPWFCCLGSSVLQEAGAGCCRFKTHSAPCCVTLSRAHNSLCLGSLFPSHLAGTL